MTIHVKIITSGGERYDEEVLKIVVFDSCGEGEYFADKLESELPVVEIIRVVDWRGAKRGISPKDARKIAEQSLKPYIGRVDLIILANYLLTMTSLNYFRRKYKSQKFIGFELSLKHTLSNNRKTLIIATKDITKSFEFFISARRAKTKTVCTDNWSILTNGESAAGSIQKDLYKVSTKIGNFSPTQILLLCGQLARYAPEFRMVFGHNVRVVNGTDDAIKNTFRTLKIRGGTGKKSG